MSGHSKWSTIKHQKEAQDKKRGQIFGKLARLIAIAAKNGPDPEKNPRLRMEIDRARKFNMPKENIQRAIERGSGGNGSENLEGFIYEALGPENVGIIVEGITDNRNRSAPAIKQIFTKHGCKPAGEGSVVWMFARAGTISVAKPQDPVTIENFSLACINEGAEDIRDKNDSLEIVVSPEKLETLKNFVTEQKFAVTDASVSRLPKNPVSVFENTKKLLAELYAALDEHDDVQDIYDNTAE